MACRARKSSESEDRQMQSIDDQINRLKQLAGDLRLDIVKIYTESKSAKKPNNRPLFDKMINEIECGEANGILCWGINRLSRNPIDSGKLSWILQQRTLKSIQTVDKQYLPDDNVILFNVETGSANQYILDLSKNVKRGIDGKLRKGWRPGSAPQGYLNSKFKDRGDNDIAKDPERFSLVRQMWDLMLTGHYTAPRILEIANNEWGYTTRKTKRMGGRPLSKSGIYTIFSNIFYAGMICHKGVQYQGKHEPIITKELFDKVQQQLKIDYTIKWGMKEFAFTKLLTCGHCGSSITADEKFKKLKNGTTVKYIYYGCTRGRDQSCKGGYIREEELISQLGNIIDKADINELGIQHRFDEEVKRYNRFQKGVLGIKEGEKSNKDIDLKTYLKYILKDGNITEKREVLSCLKSKVVMTNKKLTLAK